MVGWCRGARRRARTGWVGVADVDVLEPVPAAAAGVATALVSLLDARGEQDLLDRLVAASRALTGAPHGVALLTGSDGAPAVSAREGVGQGRVPVPPLVVPLTAPDGRALGELHLAHPSGGGVLGAAEEEVAAALARQAGAVLHVLRRIEAAARLHAGLGLTEERAGDGDAALGAVSPVVRRLLAGARRTTGLQVAFLSRVARGRQVLVAVDEDPGARAPLGLVEGTGVDLVDGHGALLLSGRVPTSVPDARSHPVLGALPLTRRLGVGACCGTPVHLPDGSLFGVLAALGPDPSAPLTGGQVEALRTVASLLGERLAVEEREEHLRAQERAEVEAFLDGGGRSVVVQPIVRFGPVGGAAGHRVVGFEALSRFRDADGSPRRPDEVFAAAQRLGAGAGLGVRLELAVVRDALALLPRLPADAYLSLNFSPRTLLHPAAHALLADAPLGRVVAELTEHEEVHDYAGLLRAVEPLRARGMRLAIDDTGAGFAGLQHLAELDPDVVKLDLRFVRDVHLDPARRAVARAVLGLAGEVGATLVAEGVETPQELAQLAQLGVTHGQGYLLGRPAPPPGA